MQSSTLKHQDKIWNDKLTKADNVQCSNDLWRLVESVRAKPTLIPPIKTAHGLTSSTADQSEPLADVFQKTCH